MQRSLKPQSTGAPWRPLLQAGEQVGKPAGE
jgi:hypothetical protein